MAEFEVAYAGDGEWAHLFARSPGYLGSQLLHDADQPGRYVTVDRWTTRRSFDAFLSSWQADYQALDERSGHLTVREALVGRFETA